MKLKIKASILYVLLVLFFMPACQWASSLAGSRATVTPPPTRESLPTSTATPSATATSAATATPTGPTAGSFDDFKVFAAQIAQAAQDKDASFFSGRAVSPDWNCLGDETVGICKGHASGDTLTGIPVTKDWKNYKVYNTAAYEGLWKTAFTKSGPLKLAALANQAGDNPLMPAADQAFMAVLAISGKGSKATINEVHVLYFEYSGTAWQLDGELETTTHVQDWVSNTCSACYDTWMAWP